MKSLSTLLLVLSVIGSAHSQSLPDPEQVVQANLDAYNNGDIEGFMSYFSEDITVKNFDTGAITAENKKAVREIYTRLFESSPDLHSRILKRTVFDNKVIDHEYITGRNGSQEPLELVLIYEVRDSKIFRISVMRKS
ncbi:MAG: nuclear transport factor 2 family protein [Lutimonas sp.]